MHHALAAAQAADNASYTGWTVGFIIGGLSRGRARLGG